MQHNLIDTPRKRYALFSMLVTFVSLIGGSILLPILVGGGALYFHGGAAIALAVLLGLATVASFLLSFLYRDVAPASHAVFRGHLSALLFHIGFMAILCAFGGYHIVTGILTVRNSALSGICLILSGLFALGGLRFSMHSIGKNALRTVLSGTSLTLACLFYAFYLYFDNTSPKNASMKQLLILVFLFLALFFLSEIRRILGKAHGIFYRLVITVTLQLCAAMSVAPLVLQILGRGPGVGDICAYLLITLMFLYTFAWSIAPHFWLSGKDTEFPPFVPAEPGSDVAGSQDITAMGDTEE